MLPQKALNALIDIRTPLLSRELVSQEQPLQPSESGGEKKSVERKPLSEASPSNGRKSHVMRHARQRGMSYQRYKQRQGW